MLDMIKYLFSKDNKLTNTNCQKELEISETKESDKIELALNKKLVDSINNVRIKFPEIDKIVSEIRTLNLDAEIRYEILMSENPAELILKISKQEFYKDFMYEFNNFKISDNIMGYIEYFKYSQHSKEIIFSIAREHFCNNYQNYKKLEKDIMEFIKEQKN